MKIIFHHFLMNYLMTKQMHIHSTVMSANFEVFCSMFLRFEERKVPMILLTNSSGKIHGSFINPKNHF